MGAPRLMWGCETQLPDTNKTSIIQVPRLAAHQPDFTLRRSRARWQVRAAARIVLARPLSGAALMTPTLAILERSSDRGGVKGLRQFLDPEQQRAWMEGEIGLADRERSESLEQRFKYAARFEK